jgi:hypothetical protein
MQGWKGLGRRGRVRLLCMGGVSLSVLAGCQMTAAADSTFVGMAQVQEAAALTPIHGYIARYVGTYAGSWFSVLNGHAVFNVGFTSDVRARTDDLSALFAYPAQLAVQAQRYSAMDLQRVADRVQARTSALAEKAFAVVTIGPDFAANTVTVGISGSLADAQRFVAEELPGAPLTVHPVARLFTVGRAAGTQPATLTPLIVALFAAACLVAGGVAWKRRHRAIDTAVAGRH